MALESTSGLNVKNHYGVRDTGRAAGNIKTEGAKNQLAIEFTAAQVSDGLFAEDYIIPAGSMILGAYVEIEEAFVLGGTTPTILIGTDTSEVTNGLVIDEVEAEAVGGYSLTTSLAGTWDAEAALAAATTVGIALGGTTPTITTAGKGRVVIEYIKAGQ